MKRVGKCQVLETPRSGTSPNQVLDPPLFITYRQFISGIVRGYDFWIVDLTLACMMSITNLNDFVIHWLVRLCPKVSQGDGTRRARRAWLHT